MAALRTALSLLLICTVVSATTQAWASDKSKAKRHFRKGQTHYKLGRFEKALTEFSAAYELMDHGAFLFNIGQCHRQLSNHERAVFFFEGYLREIPGARNRSVVEDLLKESRVEVAKVEEQKRLADEEKRKQDDLVRQEEELRIAQDKATALAEQERAHQAIVAAPIGSAPGGAPGVSEVGQKPPLWETWWFWTAVGGAVAVVATTTVILLSVGGGTRTELPSGSVGTLDRSTGLEIAAW